MRMITDPPNDVPDRYPSGTMTDPSDIRTDRPPIRSITDPSNDRCDRYPKGSTADPNAPRTDR